MIADYLYQLFDNCKALKRREGYEAAAIKKFFQDQVALELKAIHCHSEKEVNEKLKALEVKDLLSGKYPLLLIFFLVNSIGELNRMPECYDELGRFKYDRSVQKSTGITSNYVLKRMISFVSDHELLKGSYAGISHPSYFFLSHDIDSLYGSLLQDGAWALKKGRADVLFRLFANLLLARPHWFNIDQIMSLESEYNFRSTFYWLVNKGVVDKRQTNSDYDITSDKLKTTIQSTAMNGFEAGLHKSISEEGFSGELNKLPVKAIGNRYHYLKFKLPEAYHFIESSGLKLDGSLGFAEHYGFRNNYGYPFHPYNSETGKAFSFLEVPLNVMDGTFQRYMKVPVERTAETIVSFLDQHKENSLLSILWHNTFFTNYKYKGYLDEYKKILLYLHEQKFRNINQSGIIEQFSWKEQ